MAESMVVYSDVIAWYCDSNILGLPPLYVGQGLGDAAIAPTICLQLPHHTHNN